MWDLRFLVRLFSGVSSKRLRDSRRNSYCKKDYSKDELDLAEITQIRLHKMQKNVAMASFHCLGRKIIL